ncbi:TonB-dependent receptor [Christiangramia flava]|uniref:TonB-dependent receptor n=1 Tax=Christiangramia flava JLT2011 TaxID=1229726 RepID=A0A1L7I944_9FLAO|nr:TonB-dependent receptor [Christiangramia flava]APU69723.1 TonB-dependent receptor [Christiangramia flava JLT2011]OSS39244.1 TonB-dependent receptor [Christiangramia flava JLT2011]
MIKYYLAFLGFLVGFSIFPQQVKGIVQDAETTSPLRGASIRTTTGEIYITKENGQFSIPCETGLELQVSFVGYEPIDLKVSDCSKFLTISLRTAIDDLEEVQLSGLLHRQQTLEKPVSVVHVEKYELERGTGIFLDDAINTNVPGVTMNRRGVSSGQQFNIRGYGNGIGFRGATNNFDGQGYKVYYNNIPITDAEGVTLMDDIDFASLGQVDVVKGPAGSLYGFAIAGAINLETVKPQPNITALKQNVTIGNYGLARFTTQFQHGTDRTGLLVNYGHQTSDGYMSHNASQKDYVNAIFDFRPNDDQIISTYFGYSNSYDERGGELTIEQYQNQDYSGNARYIKNNAHSEVTAFRAGLSHSYQFNSWLQNATTVFGSGRSTNASSAGGWTDKDPINYGIRSAFDFHFDVAETISLNGIAGLEFQQQHANSLSYRMVEDPENPEGYNITGAIRSNQAIQSKTNTLFTQWTLAFPEDLSLTAGISTSNRSIDTEDRLYDPESDLNRDVHARYEGLVAPHIAINKVFSEQFSVYASYSKAYNTPVSGNIVIATTGELNEGLQPEVGKQFEVGSKGNLFQDRLFYELAVFQAKFQDKFTSVAVPAGDGTTAYTYVANGGELDNKGVEMLLKFNAYRAETGFFSNIDIFTNMTYSDFEYGNYRYQSLDGDGQPVTADYSGNMVAGVAPWVVNAGIDFQSNYGFYGNLTYNYRDAVAFTSDGENVADPYNLLNAKIGYRTDFGKFQLDAYVGANNLTGTQYYYMLFLNQLDDAYIPAPLDTVLYGGVSLNYQF